MEIVSSLDPFPHYIIDGFIHNDQALELHREFPDYESDVWFSYDTPLEQKRTVRDWGKFPPATYRFFMSLCEPAFVDRLKTITGLDDLMPDYGLHGAGWHIHRRGDHLNVHLDYNQHPLLDRTRRLNLLVYLTPDWQDQWGGCLEFWQHDPETNGPRACVTSIVPKFNRAVLFETGDTSWHGIPKDINCPEGVYRKSIAMYYVSKQMSSRPRYRARYAPRPDQRGDTAILELIQQRSNKTTTLS